jgi:hypothetical protein
MASITRSGDRRDQYAKNPDPPHLSPPASPATAVQSIVP